MVRVDNCLRVWQVREGILHYPREALAALSLISYGEVDICRTCMLLCLSFQVLATG